MNTKIQKQIRNAYLNSDIDFDTKKWHGYEIQLEHWVATCFTAEEVTDAEKSEDADHYLEDLALEKTNEIAKSENWEGGVYLYPDESQVEYGLSIFYRRAKPGIDKGDLMPKKYTLEIIGKHIGQRFVPIQEQYRRFKEFRRSRMDGHLVTLGLGGEKDAQGRYSDRARVSIWHPLDPKSPCALRKALFKAGKLQRLIQGQAKATGRFYDVYKAWLKASDSPTEAEGEILVEECLPEADSGYFEAVGGELDISAEEYSSIDDGIIDPNRDPEMATETKADAGVGRVPTGKWKLTYTGDKKPEYIITEILDVVGGYAEAMEKANEFLQANYYDWEIISLKPLDRAASGTGDEVDDLRKSEGYILKDIADAEKRLKVTKDQIETDRIQNTLKLFRKELDAVQKKLSRLGITEAKKKEPEFEKEIKAAVARILQQEKFKDILKPISFIVIRPSMPVPEIKLTYFKRTTRHYVVVLEGQLPVPKGASWIMEPFKVSLGYDESGAQPAAKLIGNIHNALLRLLPLSKKMKLTPEVIKYIEQIPTKDVIQERSMLREWYIKDEPGQFAVRLRDVMFRLLPPDWSITGLWVKGEPTHEKLIIENEIYSLAKPMIKERLAAINYQDESLFRRPDKMKKETETEGMADLSPEEEEAIATAFGDVDDETSAPKKIKPTVWMRHKKEQLMVHIDRIGKATEYDLVTGNKTGIWYSYPSLEDAIKQYKKDGWEKISEGRINSQIPSGTSGKTPPVVWMRNKHGRGGRMVYIDRIGKCTEYNFKTGGKIPKGWHNYPNQEAALMDYEKVGWVRISEGRIAHKV